MRLFLPSARAINWLLIVGFCSLGYALYLRYLGVENTPVGLACEGGLPTWFCLARKITIALYERSVFGYVALVAALINFVRPTLVCFAIGLAAACFGIVLYNVMLSGLAVALLILSLARPARGQA